MGSGYPLVGWVRNARGLVGVVRASGWVGLGVPIGLLLDTVLYTRSRDLVYSISSNHSDL